MPGVEGLRSKVDDVVGARRQHNFGVPIRERKPPRRDHPPTASCFESTGEEKPLQGIPVVDEQNPLVAKQLSNNPLLMSEGVSFTSWRYRSSRYF